MRMQIRDVLLGAATLILIVGLALASNVLLDRYAPGSAACVDAQGSWVNWPWPNVPALSPRCGEDSGAEAPAEKK
jgi:hypothetical protein